MIKYQRSLWASGRKETDDAWLFTSDTKVEGGGIMTDFEILSLVIMIASLVLNAIKFGRGGKGKKK